MVRVMPGSTCARRPRRAAGPWMGCWAIILLFLGALEVAASPPDVDADWVGPVPWQQETTSGEGTTGSAGALGSSSTTGSNAQLYLSSTSTGTSGMSGSTAGLGTGESMSEAASIDRTAPATPSVPGTLVAPEKSVAEALRTKATQIIALMRGELGVELRAEVGFELDSAQLHFLLASPRAPAFLAAIESLRSNARARDEQAREAARAELEAAKRRSAGKKNRRRRSKRLADEPAPEPSRTPFLSEAELPATTDPDALVAYSDAILAFFVLPPDRQTAILADHHAKRAEAERVRARQAQRRALWLETRKRARHLELFLAGRLPIDVDPATLLRLDLADPESWLREPGRAPEIMALWDVELDAEPPVLPRVAGLDPPMRDPPAPVVWSNEEPSDFVAAQVRMRARVDRALVAYFRLPPSDRQRLHAVHARAIEAAREAERLAASAQAQRQAEAERERLQAAQTASEVERAREAALEAAREAKSASARLMGGERARLLGIRTRQEEFAAALLAEKDREDDNHERVLELHASTLAALESTDSGPQTQRKADRIYQDLQALLRHTRQKLRAHLQGKQRDAERVPRLVQSPDEVLLSKAQREELDVLKTQIAARSEELIELDESSHWTTAQTQRVDMVMLNRDRYLLLALISDHEREQITGFGARGWQAALEELQQIELELRFRWSDVRRWMSCVAAKPGETLGSAVWVVVRLLVLFAALSWWKRQSREWLADLLGQSNARAGSSPSSSGGITMWYVERFRGPIEWWVVGWVAMRFILPSGVPEIELIWVLLQWSIAGALCVVTLDVLAIRSARARRRTRATARLRLETLRWAAIALVGSGALLALVEQAVGPGTMHAWLTDFFGLAALPLVGFFLYRWRTIIVERVAAHARESKFAQRLLALQGTRVHGVLIAVGGPYVVVKGVLETAEQLMGSFDATRRIMAYMFQREVMSRGETQPEWADARPLVEARIIDHFQPDRAAQHILDEPQSKIIDSVVERSERLRSTLTAVVGERGSGKSTFLRRLSERDDAHVFPGVINCPAIGLNGLMEALAGALECDVGDPVGVGRQLCARGIGMVCVDNLQRIVRPSIGGLRDLDRFVAFITQVGTEITWVAGMTSSSWQYVQRARGDRVFFDQSVELERWSEAQIAALINDRVELAGIEPDFSSLNVQQRQFDEEFDEDMDRLRSYYFRVIVDYSKGNPGIAIDAWRRSLFELAGSQAPLVRPFAQAELSELEGLPLPMLFTLRAIVQLEMATLADVVECTNLSVGDCTDAVRVALGIGCVQHDGDWLRISWDWYRALTTILVRQHLLTGVSS